MKNKQNSSIIVFASEDNNWRKNFLLQRPHPSFKPHSQQSYFILHKRWSGSYHTKKNKKANQTPNKPPSHSIYQYATEVYSVIPIKIKTIFKKKEKTESGFLFSCKTKVPLQHQKIPIPFFKSQRKITRFKRSQTTWSPVLLPPRIAPF